MGAINYDLTKIKAVILDIDGVISPSCVQLGQDGNPIRQINVKDGYAIQLAIKHNLLIMIISGGYCEYMKKRMLALSINEVIMNASSKIEHYRNILYKYDLKAEEVVYIGDDIPDYNVMLECGLPCCPADAAYDIKNISKYISNYNGGYGCVRDILEQIMRAKGYWLNDNAFKW